MRIVGNELTLEEIKKELIWGFKGEMFDFGYIQAPMFHALLEVMAIEAFNTQPEEKDAILDMFEIKMTDDVVSFSFYWCYRWSHQPIKQHVRYMNKSSFIQ